MHASLSVSHNDGAGAAANARSASSPASTARSSFLVSQMNMHPGAWVMASGGLLSATTACGVTPQAQKTGIR